MPSKKQTDDDRFIAEKLAHPGEVEAQAAEFDQDDQELEAKEKKVRRELRSHTLGKSSKNNTVFRIMRKTKISSLRLSRRSHPLAFNLLKTAMLPLRMKSRKVPTITEGLRSE